MLKSSRAAWALGLGLVGVVALVGPSRGQGEKAAGAARATAAPATIASVDMDEVFKKYEKVKFTSEQLKAEATARQGELGKIMAQARDVAKEMESLTPGSPDYKTRDDQLTKFKAQLEAEREKAQREFAQKEAEALSTLYKEVQVMVAAVAKHRNYTYVVKVSNEPVTGSDPNSVMAAMARSVVYADSSNDITPTVIYNLNLTYNRAKAAGGQPAARPSATAGGAAPKASR